MTIIPSSEFIRFRSIRIRAMTGSAEMESAVPMNSAKSVKLPWTYDPHRPGKRKTSPTPSMKGINTPIRLVHAMVSLRFLMTPRFISSPAANRKNSIQTCTSASIPMKAGPDTGNSQIWVPGLSHPQTVGPKYDAADELADDGREMELTHQLAEEQCGKKHYCDLQEEDHHVIGRHAATSLCNVFTVVHGAMASTLRA